MEKYGFVYVWRDRKHNRYYVGRHWGTEDDGYISSSPRLSTAQSRRPYDFKRRIVSVVHDKDQLVVEEQRWLDMIKPEECGDRYYNRTLKASTPSMRERKHSEETKRKISESQKGRVMSEETKEKLRQANLGKTLSPEVRAKIGRPFSEERKKQISETMKTHYENNPRSTETRSKISENSKRLQKEGKIGMKGKKHSKETIERMKKAQKGNGAKEFLVTHPCGKQEQVLNMREFCIQNNLHDGHMINVAKNRVKQHKGFICEYINN